jgi:flagellar motility protein MotE (MotC chaperone)
MISLNTARNLVSAGALALAIAVPQLAVAQEAPTETKANQYCESIADAAADARYELQKQSLAKMEQEIEARIKVLEAKRAEYEKWLERRNEVLAKADESVVAIYSKMRPDASAVQLTNMDEQIAAAILTRLNPRIASAVFNEMEPAKAAQIANVMTDAPKPTDSAAR